MEHDRSKLDWIDWPRQIFVVTSEEVEATAVHSAHSTLQGALIEVEREGYGNYPLEVTLHTPSLRAVYGGPTLIEALWNEMDRLMEGLMTGQGAEDGGDKFRAAELAWVLAIVTNAYDPSVDRIRAEAMRRWNEAAAQEEALNPEGADQ